jgi:hypothetical protein
MLAIMHALAKFRKYLVGARFVVKSDHNSLKYLLEQKDLNERQQKWVRKIQAYDFDIEFVKGKNNAVADALSRRPSIFAMSWYVSRLEGTLDSGICKGSVHLSTIGWENIG